jgi:DNA-binding MarR family transcriptional regulator
MDDEERSAVPGPGWSFFSNHALALIYVVQHPASTVRDIARGVDITERAMLGILRTLDDERVIERMRDGRRNTYSVNFSRLATFRRAAVAPLTPREFIEPLIETLFALSGDSVERHHASAQAEGAPREAPAGAWGFFTNQLRVLIAIAIDSSRTVHDIGGGVGVTDRAAVAIVNQLENEGLVARSREGRRNRYAIDFEAVRTSNRWSSSGWPFPQEIVDVCVRGLRAIATRSGD